MCVSVPLKTGIEVYLTRGKLCSDLSLRDKNLTFNNLCRSDPCRSVVLLHSSTSFTNGGGINSINLLSLRANAVSKIRDIPLLVPACDADERPALAH